MTLENYSSNIVVGGEEMHYSLKELRAKKNWSQKDVADELNVSVQSYNAWENDFGCVKIKMANKIARLFSVTLDDIFFEDELENYSSNEVENE